MNWRYRQYSLAAAVALLTLALYAPAVQNGFVNWDDMDYVVNNLHIRSLDWPFLRWAFTDVSVTYWHPVTWLSHALDYALWGMRPAGHHLTSILLHALNAFLVVLLAVRLLEASKETALRSGREFGMDDGSFLVAAGVTGVLFGSHPLHVESVAWVSERKDLLCALFTLLSLLSYAAAVRPPEERAGLRALVRNRNYVLSLVLFVLALLSKPMAVTVPVVLLLLDWYPFGRMTSWKTCRAAVAEKAPFAAASLVMSVVALSGQRALGAMVPLEGFSGTARILTAAHALVAYLGKMALPVHLVPLYPEGDRSVFSFGDLRALVLVCGITAACVVMVKRQRAAAVLWGYYVITLLPVLGLVRVGTATVADRFTYLASLGPFLFVGLVTSKAAAGGRHEAVVRPSLVLVGACLIAALSLATLKQISIWRDSISLWSSVIEAEPYRVPLAYNNRGDALREAGRLDLAIEDYTTTIALEPSFAAMAYVNRGIAFDGKGQPERAVSDFSTALVLKPGFVSALISRGFVLVKEGRLDQAIEDLDAAVRLDPSNVDAYLNRGVADERMGRYDRAVEDYGRAIGLDPWDHLAYGNRGKVLGALGRIPEALADLSKALSLRPDLPQAYLDRGGLYRSTGRTALAVEDYRMACDLGSDAGCAALRETR